MKLTLTVVIVIVLLASVAHSGEAPTQVSPRDDLVEKRGRNLQMIDIIYSEADVKAKPYQDNVNRINEAIAKLDKPAPAKPDETK